MPPVPGLAGLGPPMSRPTSVPGFGLSGLALVLMFCPFELTPIARPGSPAPSTTEPTLFGPLDGFPAGLPVADLLVVGAAVVLEGASVVVVVASLFLSFFQNFHPASTSATMSESASSARNTVAPLILMVCDGLIQNAGFSLDGYRSSVVYIYRIEERVDATRDEIGRAHV